MAPELELRYETLYAYIQDDVSKRRPTVDLALRLFCSDAVDRIECRQLLVAPAPMIAQELAQLNDDGYTKGAGLLGNAITLDRKVADYLLGSDSVDPRLESFTRPVRPSTTWNDVVIPIQLKSQLVTLTESLREDLASGFGTILQLVGAKGTGKKTAAQAICRSMGRNLTVVSTGGLLASDMEPNRAATLIFREAKLQESVPYIDDFHLMLGEDSRQQAMLASLTRALSKHSEIAILGGETHWRPGAESGDNTFITLDIPSPGYSERKQLWEIHLNGERATLGDEEVSVLAGKFRLRGGQIRQATATARDMARLRSWSNTDVTPQDLNAASRWHSNQRLTRLAKKINPNYEWDDIVLPTDPKAQLKEIGSYFSNMSLVYEEWGFQSKTNLGKGLNALFVGQSGTGKTMAADIISGELGLDLYKIDLSGIVSKYIGETEKNLDRIFQEARDSNAILFFDEADALFGKRSEVKDSHDRYANIEISYLLQKMEEYQGIVILATNFRKNMDDAFVRRMHFVVEFPFPEEEDRLEIWRRVFPEKAPLDDSFDIGFLARQFKIAGGNIKNVAVTSAFLAAQENKTIEMRHAVLATKREYQKMGKLMVESEFGPYFGLVKPNQRR